MKQSRSLLALIKIVKCSPTSLFSFSTPFLFSVLRWAFLAYLSVTPTLCIMHKHTAAAVCVQWCDEMTALYWLLAQNAALITSSTHDGVIKPQSQSLPGRQSHIHTRMHAHIHNCCVTYSTPSGLCAHPLIQLSSYFVLWEKCKITPHLSFSPGGNKQIWKRLETKKQKGRKCWGSAKHVRHQVLLSKT